MDRCIAVREEEEEEEEEEEIFYRVRFDPSPSKRATRDIEGSLHDRG